jgi:acyl-homoserine lactone acylase PvdQ
MRSVLPIAGAAALVLGLASSSVAKGPVDYAAVAWNVLPPGQSGSLTFGPNATDQLRLYDALTPLFDNVRAADVARFFKRAPLGLGAERAVRVERTPRPGVRIVRDRWGVPHVSGRTRYDVEYGAGWVTAEDRGLLMNLLRGPGRISALDVPGVDAFSLVGSGRDIEPSAATEAFLAQQVELVRRAGPQGRQLLRDVDAYLAGVNAYTRSRGLPTPPWTRNDVIAVSSLLGAVFGAGGGDETRRSQFLDALAQRSGDLGTAVDVWNDLRAQLDPEAPVSAGGNFAFYRPPEGLLSDTVVEDGSFVPAGPLGPAAPQPPSRRIASNAVLIGARRSATGRPIFVAGPQVGYYYPEILLELDLSGGGIDARGASFPGISFYVLLGRGKDFAWSATSAQSDVIDQFAETLCGDDLHYVYRGACREMATFDAGVLRGAPGEADRRLVFRTTVHGPVIGYARTRSGKRIAISLARSTRGRELLSALAFQELNTNRVDSARSFLRAMNRLEFVFNWFYADARNIAMFSSGRIPVRAPGVDLGLPTPGTGEFEWRGFVPFAGHPQTIDPAGGTILNWNNKPGRGVASADDNWSYGSVQRVDLLRAAVGETRRHTVASAVAAMNKAATQDLRAVRVVPVLERVLRTGTAPSERANRMLLLLSTWSQNGGSRLDRDLDGRIDDPGAAILDAAWPRLTDAVVGPVLGPLVDRLGRLLPRDDPANPGGSAYYGGWYGYVDKDLRTLLGEPVAGPFRTRFCGRGDLAACRASLWAALDSAGAELAAAQGPEAAAWRADATRERIRFAGFLPNTMRWSNRPTFQQVMSFRGHRRR